MTLKRKAIRGSVLLTAGEAIVYGASFARNMLLARLLTKADFGIAATFSMVVMLLEFSPPARNFAVRGPRQGRRPAGFHRFGSPRPIRGRSAWCRDNGRRCVAFGRAFRLGRATRGDARSGPDSIAPRGGASGYSSLRAGSPLWPIGDDRDGAANCDHPRSVATRRLAE